MRRLRSLFAVLASAVAAVGMAAPAASPLDRAVADLARGNGVAAEQDIWMARRQGVSVATTHHLMARAYLLQGDGVRALQEADPAQIPPAFAADAARTRIKADLLKNDTVAARAELNQAIAAAPLDDSLWADLARSRAKDGDLAGAIEAGHRAAALNPRSVDALLLSASLERDQMGLRAAIPWFKRVLAIDPKNIAALLELAATQGDSGEDVAMLATTRRVLAIDKANPQAFYLQAVMAERAGHPNLARALLYHTAPTLDKLPSVIMLKGIIEFDSGNIEQALSQFNILLEMQPQNFQVRRLLAAAFAQSGDDYSVIDILLPIATRPDADSYTLTMIARAYEDLEQRAEAATYLDRANQSQRGDATPFDPGATISLLARNDTDAPNSAEAAIPYLQGLMLTGDFNTAVTKAQALAQLNPGVPLAHILVGDAQMAAGHYPDAIRAYGLAASISFTEPVTLRLLKAMQMNHSTPDAIQLLARFRAQNPTNVPALQLSADLDMVQGHWAAATNKLENLRARLGNSDANLLNTLASCWYNQGDPARALVYARAAYALQPGNATVSNTYGWLLFQTSVNHADGLPLLEKAVTLAPSNPALRLQLGQAYLTLGQKGAARYALAPIAANPKFAEQPQAARLLSHL